MILDGKKVSLQVKEEIKKELEEIKEKTGMVPGLAIVLVGDNPASKIYVNSKIKGCSELGFESFAHFLPADVSEEELLNVIDELNKNDKVDGILVQLPLPEHIDENKVIDKIALEKDIDGFKPENLGLLFLGNRESIKSCTPAGIMELLKRYEIELAGKDAVIIGRSNIVGKPMAGFFITEGATVTVCNSKTKNIEEKLKNADIIVAALGVDRFVKEDMVKEGAVVVDVGINRTPEGLFGDVDFENVSKKASWITPVPGGVGPMTVAMLFKNTMQAFKKNKNLN